MTATELRFVENHRAGRPDDVFVCCSNIEQRCLGSLAKFSNYGFTDSYIFFQDEANEQEMAYLAELERRLGRIGSARRILIE